MWRGGAVANVEKFVGGRSVVDSGSEELLAAVIVEPATIAALV
jgi:hypothetical protein